MAQHHPEPCTTNADTESTVLYHEVYIKIECKRTLIRGQPTDTPPQTHTQRTSCVSSADTEADSSCRWLVSSHYQLDMGVPATLSSGQSVAKSLWSVSPYLPRHTLCSHEVTPTTVVVLCLLHLLNMLRC